MFETKQSEFNLERIKKAFDDSNLINGYRYVLISTLKEVHGVGSNTYEAFLHPNENVVRVDVSKSTKIDGLHLMVIRWLVQKDKSYEPIGYYAALYFTEFAGFSNSGSCYYHPESHKLTIYADRGEFRKELNGCENKLNIKLSCFGE